MGSESPEDSESEAAGDCVEKAGGDGYKSALAGCLL